MSTNQVGLPSHAQLDTLWASIERRTTMLLQGEPVQIPSVAVNPDHALSRFPALGGVVLRNFPSAEGNSRNLRKISLECWNAYASAEGLIEEPCVLRREMEAHAFRIEETLAQRRSSWASRRTPARFRYLNWPIDCTQFRGYAALAQVG